MLIACSASSSSMRAVCATFATLANWTNPSSSISAINMSHTIRVGVGSSQIEDRTIFEKSLLYILPNHFEDLVRDLRDDGVSESFKSVHPRGNPMSHSTHVGFR